MAIERAGITVLDQLYLFFLDYTMKKLLQLLNEYQTERGSKFKFSSYDANSSAFIIENNPRMVLGEETILSKKF